MHTFNLQNFSLKRNSAKDRAQRHTQLLNLYPSKSNYEPQGIHDNKRRLTALKLLLPYQHTYCVFIPCNFAIEVPILHLYIAQHLQHAPATCVSQTQIFVINSEPASVLSALFKLYTVLLAKETNTILYLSMAIP